MRQSTFERPTPKVDLYQKTLQVHHRAHFSKFMSHKKMKSRKFGKQLSRIPFLQFHFCRFLEFNFCQFLEFNLESVLIMLAYISQKND